MDQPEHVVVVGAGYVGAVAATGLAAAGRRVTAIRRSTVPAAGRSPGVEHLALDVLDPTRAGAVPDDADVLVFAMSPGGRTIDDYVGAHVTAPAAVLERQRRPPRLVLLLTSTAVYGQDDGSWVDEDSPTVPAAATAEVLLAAEQDLAQLEVPSASLRLGGIYGPGRDRLVRQVAAGEATCLAGHWSNRIHRDDAASAIVHLVTTATAVPATCNVVDDAPAMQCEVVTWLAEQLGAPAPAIRPEGAGSGRQATSKRVRNDRLRSTGWVPAHPSFRDGYRAMLADGRATEVIDRGR